MLGVLEYIRDTDAFFAHLWSSNRDVVLSYCATDLSSVDRASLGWITHFSFLDLAQLFDRHGFRIESTIPVDSLQILMRLAPVDQQTPMNPCSVAVISYNDVGNFGDRLSYHMINSLLPSEASVHHLTFQTLDRAHDSYDLVVLGIGNSIYPFLFVRVRFLVGLMRPHISSDEAHRIAFGFSPPLGLYFATRLRDGLGERGARPAGQGPSGSSAPGKQRIRSASGHAAANARRMRLAVSTTRAAIFKRRRRRVANSAVANSRTLGMASRTVSINQ